MNCGETSTKMKLSRCGTPKFEWMESHGTLHWIWQLFCTLHVSPEIRPKRFPCLPHSCRIFNLPYPDWFSELEKTL